MPPVPTTAMRMSHPEQLSLCRAAEQFGCAVLLGDVAVGVVGQKRGGADADYRAERDIERHRIARPGRREERRRDQRRRTTGDDRGQVKPERRAAVTEPCSKAL